MVRLGSGSGDMKHLGAEAIDRAVATLDRFRQVAETWDAQVVAVATSATREALNRQTFLDRARDEAGVDVAVISGMEEARLIHLGVLQAVPVYGRGVLVIDIGGGSTELIVGRAGRMLAARSLKLGAIRLTDRFFPRDVSDPESIEACRAYARAFLNPAVREIRRARFSIAVGSSGTVAAAVAMSLARRGERPRSLNAVTMTRDDLDGVVASLEGAPARCRSATPCGARTETLRHHSRRRHPARTAGRRARDRRADLLRVRATGRCVARPDASAARGCSPPERP